jgi:hypothetical protein
MTPEMAVTQLAEIITANPDLSDNEIYDAMVQAGVPNVLAGRAFKFTQIAWGRLSLSGMNIRFSPDYACLNAGGDIVETGLLDNESCYIIAKKLAGKYVDTPAYQRLALTSAEVNAVNNALKDGSKPENLRAAPAFLFNEPPTDDGMRRAQQSYAEFVKSLKEQN